MFGKLCASTNVHRLPETRSTPRTLYKAARRVTRILAVLSTPFMPFSFFIPFTTCTTTSFMTSFLRNLFSAGPQHGPARSRSKGHSRSNSTPPMEPRPMSTYVLINPAGNAGSKPSSPISKSRPKSTRTSSYSSATGQQPPAPSPLRYTTHDTAPSHRHGTTSLSGHQGSSSGRSTHERPPIPRSSSYKGERQPSEHPHSVHRPGLTQGTLASNYSIYAPRVSLSSTRSASSTAASHTAPSTTPSYGSVSSKASKPRRPVLKQTHTWNGTQKPHNPRTLMHVSGIHIVLFKPHP